MILPRLPLYPVLGMFLVTGILSPAPAADEGREDVQTLNSAALASMEADRWDDAHKLLARCIELHDKDALARFGPQFGVTWYRKGICELRLNRWEEAVASFETCYRRFPNQGEQGQDGGNLFHKRALLRWAEAAQGAGDYEGAIRLFGKFLEERDKTRDTFDPGSYYINLSICHSKLNMVSEGIANLETAIRNNLRFRTPEAGVRAAFEAMVGAVIKSRDEKSLLSFIDRNRAGIIGEPLEMEIRSSLFLKLAGDALDAGMDAGAIALYQLVPSTDALIEDLRSHIGPPGNPPGREEPARRLVRSSLEASCERLDLQRRGGDPNEVIQLGAIAFIHEKHGNVRGAFAAYEQLELFFPKSKKREEHLYHLVRTSAVIAEVMATGSYGSRFLECFPDSKHAPAVRQMMLNSLFNGGEYAECVKVASEMLPALAEGSQEHDMCLHVLGASYYHTAAYDTAQPLLDQHVAKYPASRFRQAALYFQASTLTRRQLWGKAATRLDAFFEKHPDPAENPYYPFGLYDRANCHYAANENAPALEKLDRLEKEFPDVEILAMACNLKGNVLQSEGKRDEAESCYKKALELAGHRGNRKVEGEALYYLVALLGENTTGKSGNPRLTEAVPYADKFWKEHGSDSPYKNLVAVSQTRSLVAAGRGEEALDRLRDAIAEMAANPADHPLEEAVKCYTDAYLGNHSVDELKNHYDSFPKINPENQAARSLLRIAILDASEDELMKPGGDKAEKDKAEARIALVFQELKNGFDPKALSNSVLIRTGDFLRSRTSAPRQALPYYEEALSRQDPSSRFAALLGRASVLAEGSKEERATAIDDLKRVFADSRDPADREHALFAIIQARMAGGDHGAAEAAARQYLSREDHPDFTRFAPEVGFALARSFHLRGRTDEALAEYSRVWSTFQDRIRISAPALKAWMELSWQRNSPGGGTPPRKSDRQQAYEAGWAYIDRIHRAPGKMSDEENQAWQEIQALVTEYEASPDVKAMAKVKEDAAMQK